MARQILIVEDDPALAATLEIALSQIPNLEILTVSDGQFAIDHLTAAQQCPAAVITDLDLPRVDGLHLIRWMRNSPRLLRTPVLAVSANPAESEALAAGANKFLPKPYKPADIRKALQELLHADQI